MLSKLSSALLVGAVALVHAQNPDETPESHPSLTTYKCTTAGGCTAQDTSVVIDWNYHWFHTSDWLSCTTNTGVNSTLCPNTATCAKNCQVQGDSNYTANGVTTSGDSLTMRQFMPGADGYQSVSPRLYLLGPDGNYPQIKLLNQELTFTVDLSTLPCGENGALYLSEMDATGGRNQYNTGGANYGSGYCDAQCPVQTWKNGTLNTSGSGYCCNEMDILEANSRAIAFTPHPCSATDCDRGGCGFNPYALGHQSYYGPGGTVDTNKPFTVVTQFLTNDGTARGTLTQVTRKYIQNGKLIASAVSGGDTITAEGCLASGTSAAFGGLSTMGQALGRGMTLIFAIWNDSSQFMNWLDSNPNGPCSSTEGDPAIILRNHPDTRVIFSNIRWGDIGSTFSTSQNPSSTTRVATTSRAVTTGATTTSKQPTTTGTAAGPTQTHYGQCNGQGWTGPTVCESPWKCTFANDWYSQCL
ncbi:endoglucanase I [Stachybotrys elegans]|uniref:Glucanase n=1 Tax=Stachybotrys elegans TaxID=80388 RepID=A0A8K0SGD2_9HYPO|nr:endoglucanase I [Stachybotrys elegans]